MQSTFSLRKLEMAMPHLLGAEGQDPKALAHLAAIAMADEQTLKLAAAGNQEALSAYLDKAYELPSEEVAALLAGFIEGSARFKLRLNGFSPEEVNTILKSQKQAARADKGLASPAE